MITSEIESKINNIIQLGQDRKVTSEHDDLAFELTHEPFFYLTDSEKENLHSLKQSLPGFAQTRIDAKRRNAARFAARKLARQANKLKGKKQ